MIDVLKTTKYVADNSKLVKISREAVEKLVNSIRESELESLKSSWFVYDWPLYTQLELVFIFNSINFCYWAKKDELKWTVEFDDKMLDGAMALLRCIEEEAMNNQRFLFPETLANFSEDDLRRITKGNTEIPLFNERLRCLRGFGQVAKDKYGSYIDIIEKSGNDAIKLVEITITDFPEFNDVSEFDGKNIGFYKRAQLNAEMINNVLILNAKFPQTNMDKLTAFADYKVPQILRKLGILEYAPDLANKIDNFELIAANSIEEVEIRANTVWAVELIREKLSETFPVVSSEVDTVLWARSQKKEPGEKPYHRTLTTAY